MEGEIIGTPPDFLSGQNLASPLGKERWRKRGCWAGAEVAVAALAVKGRGCRVDRQTFMR